VASALATDLSIRRRRAAVRALVSAASLGAIAVVTVLGSSRWMVRSHDRWVYRSAEVVPPRSVAIVPGARVHRGGRPSDVLEDRLHAARRLYRTGRVRRVLVSGDHESGGYDEANAMQRWLVSRGVPSEDVFIDHAGLRTLDTMERAARVFQVGDAVVCTQAFHAHRAVFLARRARIDAVGLVADRSRYRHARRDRAREELARALAVVDSYVLRRGPRFLGPTIPIDTSDAHVTHDRRSSR
jgi:SanA protein